MLEQIGYKVNRGIIKCHLRLVLLF